MWNWVHLRPWLSKAGFSEHMLETQFIPFGQGYKSMSPAVRDLETLILERKLRHGNFIRCLRCASPIRLSSAATPASKALEETIDGPH